VRDNSPLPLARFLQGAACVVTIAWGVRTFSEILGPLLLGLMLAYAVAPVPKWMMHRLKLPKSRAVGVTAIALLLAGLVTVFAIEVGVARLTARVPIYEQRLASLTDQVAHFLIAHGVGARGVGHLQRLRRI